MGLRVEISRRGSSIVVCRAVGGAFPNPWPLQQTGQSCGCRSNVKVDLLPDRPGLTARFGSLMINVVLTGKGSLRRDLHNFLRDFVLGVPFTFANALGQLARKVLFGTPVALGTGMVTLSRYISANISFERV